MGQLSPHVIPKISAHALRPSPDPSVARCLYSQPLCAAASLSLLRRTLASQPRQAPSPGFSLAPSPISLHHGETVTTQLLHLGLMFEIQNFGPTIFFLV
jgi:hypothetical protein